MKSRLRFRLAALLLCVILAVVTVPVQAQSGYCGACISKGQIAGIVVGAVAGGVAIGVGVYYLTRKVSVTGCAVSNQSGFELQNEGDQQTYLLTGDTANIKAGDRVRVKGKKKKKDSSGHRSFLVEKLAEDYGPCRVQPATP